MPPNEFNTTTGVLFHEDAELDDGGLKHDITRLKAASPRRRWQFVWLNMFLFPISHGLALYGLWQAVTLTADVRTTLFCCLGYWYSMLGVLGGTHRLWAHRAFTPSRGLEWFLMLGATVGYQNSVIHWAREHRVHHKFSETDADPVNASRGLFFSHMGWLLVRKHPDVALKGRAVDVSDLERNPVLAFNKRHYVPLTFVMAFAVPLLVPVLAWGESWAASFCVAVALRWVCSLHGIFFINSVAHKYGQRPYDSSMSPSEVLSVSWLNGGEGYHNYHHAFPWDYRAAEYGYANFTGWFIEMCARQGWAWDLKTTSEEMVRKRAQRTGDGSHHLWGWGDPEQEAEERSAAKVTHVRPQ